MKNRVPLLTHLGSDLWAVHEGQAPEFPSISINSINSINSTPIPTMIGLIGNHLLEARPGGTRLFGRALGSRCPKLTAPSRSGEPPAEGAVAFSSW